MKNLKSSFIAVEAFLIAVAELPNNPGESKAMAEVDNITASLDRYTEKRSKTTSRYVRSEKYFRFMAFGFVFDLTLRDNKLVMDISHSRTEYLGLDGMFHLTITNITQLDTWDDIHTLIADAVDVEQRKVAETNLAGRDSYEEFIRAKSGFRAHLCGFSGAYNFTLDNKEGESCGAVNFYELVKLTELLKARKASYGNSTDFWIVDKRNTKPFFCMEPKFCVIYALRETEVDGETHYVGKFNNDKEMTYSVTEYFDSDETIINETYCHELDMKFKRCPADASCSIIGEWLNIKKNGYSITKDY